MGHLQFKLTAGTHPGCVRSNNEDNFLVSCDLGLQEWILPSEEDQDTLRPIPEQGILLTVADGMGGMNAGEVASQLAMETVSSLIVPSRLPSGLFGKQQKIQKLLSQLVVDADAHIKKEAEANPACQGMGTTLVVALIQGQYAHIGWCGDSRAYVFSKKGVLMQLTKDHSYVQELVDAGTLDANAAFTHPQNNLITRSLGDPSGSAVADVLSFKLHDGDLLLLCSDGLCSMIRNSQLEGLLNQQRAQSHTNEIALGPCRKALIDAALEAGGYDNVTVALCQVFK